MIDWLIFFSNSFFTILFNKYRHIWYDQWYSFFFKDCFAVLCTRNTPDCPGVLLVSTKEKNWLRWVTARYVYVCVCVYVCLFMLACVCVCSSHWSSYFKNQLIKMTCMSKVSFLCVAVSRICDPLPIRSSKTWDIKINLYTPH